MAVKPIPDGFHSVTPYLVVPGVAKLIDFLKQAFGARETERMAMPDGTIMHAQVTIDDSPIMMGEPPAQHPAAPTHLYLYVKDVDAVYRRALQAGGVSVMEPADQFYGDRHGSVKDPSGNTWWIATHIEDVSWEEIERRAKSKMTKGQSG
jgi:PhnB protein